jgi:hypothetical protein
MFGESFSFGSEEFKASKDDFEFAKMFMNLTEQLLFEVCSDYYCLNRQPDS